MSELPGMWDESDLRGGETDCAEDLLIVRKLKEENAALKEENERLKAEKVRINGKLAGSRLAVIRLKARVAELTAPAAATAMIDRRMFSSGVGIMSRGPMPSRYRQR